MYVESDTLMERSGPSVPEVEAGMRKSVSDRLQQLVAPEPAALGPYPLSKEFLVGAPESGTLNFGDLLIQLHRQCFTNCIR